MRKYSYNIIFIFCILTISGCSPVTTEIASSGEPSNTPEKIEITLTPEHIEPTIVVEKNQKPIIESLTTTIGSLCQEKITQISFSANDPDNDSLSINWETQHGQVFQDEDQYFYQAPVKLPDSSIDTITLNVSDEEESVSRTISILLIENDDSQGWNQTGGPEGGLINTIEIDQHNPDVLYAGGFGGSLVKTSNGGDSWEILPKFLDSGEEIHEIIIDPSNPNILYIRARAIYKTEDAGMTYKKVFQEVGNASSLDINQTKPAQLLVGTWDGRVFLTENGGGNWVQLFVRIPANTSITSAAIASESELWVGTHSWGEEQFGEIYHSKDTGRSWSKIDNLDPAQNSSVQSILVNQKGNPFIYVGLRNVHNERFDQNERYLLKSTDGGASWENLTITHGHGWGSGDLMGLTSWDETLYVGRGPELVYQSKDGGKSFKALWGIGNNGDFNDIAVDPRDTDILYLPSRSYGILKSYDGGESWEWINKGLHFMGLALLETNLNANNGVVLGASAKGEGEFISSDFGETWDKVPVDEITHPWADEMKINPHNTNEFWYTADVAEVFISKDKGITWKRIIETSFEAPGFRFGSTYALAVAPSNPDRLYVEKNGFGIFRSSNIENGYYFWDFLHQSEIDYTYSIAVDPSDENILYSGVIPKPFQDSAYIRKSSDGGNNWETILTVPNSAGITSVALASDLPNRVYAAGIGSSPQLFRSESSGDTWVKLSPPWDINSIKDGTISYIEIVPHPGDPNIVYISAYPGGVFLSKDAGGSWEKIDLGLPSYQVVDGLRQGRYNLAVSDTNPNILYVGIFDEGVYKSSNNGESWELTNIKSKDLGILALAIDLEDENVVYIGSREGVFQSTDSGANWIEFHAGSHIADTDVRTLVFSPDSTLYAGTLGYEVFKLEPGDSSWHQINSLANFGTFWPLWDGRPLYQYTFLVFHPEDPDTLLFGTFPAGIYISHDGGESWQESNTSWTWDGVFSLVYHPQDSNIIFAGTYNGVNRSVDGGETWEMWDQGWPDEQWVFSIDFDPRDSNIMYAASKNGENEGKGQPGIFMGTVMKSIDGGETWFEIMQGLPRTNEFYKIIVDPHAPDTIYLASQKEGIFISRDQGKSWVQWNEGLTNIVSGTNGNNVTNTMALSPDGLQLYFATSGAGVYRRMTVNALAICGCTP